MCDVHGGVSCFVVDGHDHGWQQQLPTRVCLCAILTMGHASESCVHTREPRVTPKPPGRTLASRRRCTAVESTLPQPIAVLTERERHTPVDYTFSVQTSCHENVHARRGPHEARQKAGVSRWFYFTITQQQ